MSDYTKISKQVQEMPTEKIRQRIDELVNKETLLAQSERLVLVCELNLRGESVEVV